LNVRAQAYARDAGWLGDRALELGGVRFSEGDRILCLENRERDIGVRRRDHAIGTAVGIVPGSVAFVALGDSIADPGSVGFMASLGAVAVLVAASVVRSRRSARSVTSGE